MEKLEGLIEDFRACRVCEAALPLGPKPYCALLAPRSADARVMRGIARSCRPLHERCTMRSEDEGGKLRYEYDFGDGWEHEIKVEKALDADPTTHYPRCTAGNRACPPDDCGGPFGYEELLRAIQAPSHPEHEEMLDWIGGEFDPEAFDLAGVNRALWGGS